jgi:tetratricopeptide (TPR) repeat protein
MKVASVFVLGALASCAGAQVYDVTPNAPKTNQAQPSQTQSTGQQLGFGSNIENARLARAAELALQHGDKVEALDYARRAAQAAPGNPALWFLVGYAARLNLRLQESADSYSRGLRLTPGSLEGQSGLAQTYSMMGRTEEAQRILKKIIEENPKRRDDTLLLGDITMRTGDYAGALEWLLDAERLRADVRAELLLAISYQHLKQLDLSNKYLEMAEHRAPDNPEVRRTMAGYYRETGNYAKAIEELKAIPSPKPDVTAELAFTYQLDGKLDESARLYAQAAYALPKDLGLQLSAAQAEVALGSIEKADPFLARAAKIDANHYRLHSIRAEIAKIQERDQDALREYLAALASLPAEPAEGPLYGIQLHMNLMEVYKDLSDDSGAHHELETAQTEINALGNQVSNRGGFLRLRATIKMNTGDLDGALGDMKEALALNPNGRDDLQLDGDILVKIGRTEDAITVYKQILAADPVNRSALTSLGYASRVAGRDQEAEKYFQLLAQADPKYYVPHLALGDLYAARRDFPKAQDEYGKAYAMSPGRYLIMAGGMNAAIEAQNLSLAGTWLGRVTPGMDREPQILREKERYLRGKGDYQASAAVGRDAIKVLPKDRDVVVYLGYDLLHLEKWDELLALTSQYLDVFPREPDIPLLEGYVHKHEGLNEEARRDFTEALNRDPNVVTAYVNRGYTLNDLHQPKAAGADFEAALKREPDNGEAHLGLAYASLNMHRPQIALREANLAEKALGDSRDIHLIRATAYGREDMLLKAADEYRAALKFTPDDGLLHLGLGNTIFSERKYHEAIVELEIAAKDSPDEAEIYALLARSYANLKDRNDALRNVQLAEQHAEHPPASAKDSETVLSDIYVSTGQALSALGDHQAAMDRFAKALSAPGSDRVGVRMAIAQLMADQDHNEDAERQIALAQMEGEAGETEAPTGSQYIAAADVFRTMHEYQLSQTYLDRAKGAGAPDAEVRIGLANNYLAIGDTARAKAQLAAVSAVADNAPDYQYLLAKANVQRQEHHEDQALTSFAQASSASGEDQTAEQGLLQAGADEGLRITPLLSVLADFSIDAIFEDSTVYVLDSKLDGNFPVPPTDTSLLPPPRSSLETQNTDAFHLHVSHLPTVTGFFQVRNAQGQISAPAINSIVNRDTTDYVFNAGLNPTVSLGRNVFQFDGGIQEIIRRDSKTPVALNQNLFREFAYMSTSSFFNELSVSGYVIHETGPLPTAICIRRRWPQPSTFASERHGERPRWLPVGVRAM